MTKPLSTALFFALCAWGPSCASTPSSDPGRLEWMETDQEALKTWVEKSNTRADTFYKDSAKDTILAQIKPSPAAPGYFAKAQMAKGGFYFVKEGQKAEPDALYFQDFNNNNSHLYVDLESIKKPGSQVQIAYYKVSPDGQSVALGLSLDGSERAELWIYNVGKKSLTATGIKNTRIALLEFLPDGSGFLFNKHDHYDDAGQKDRTLNSSLRLFSLKTMSESDNLLLDKTQSLRIYPSDHFYTRIVKEQNLVFLLPFRGTVSGYRVYYKKLDDLLQMNVPWKELADEEHLIASFAAASQAFFYVQKPKDSPPTITRWIWKNGTPQKTAIAFSANEEVDDISAGQFCLFVKVRSGLLTKLQAIDYDSLKRRDIVSGAGEYVSRMTASSMEADVLVRILSYKRPDREVLISYKNGSLKDLQKNQGPGDDLEEVINYADNQGTKIPYTVIKPAKMQLTPDTPVMVMAYGSYGYVLRPYFSKYYSAWHNLGGVMVYCHVRGGGELGKAWHEAGKRSEKTKSLEDTVACIDDLVKKGHTSYQRAVFDTSSAGGVIAGGLLAHYPEKFAGISVSSGILNITRADQWSGGTANQEEFGSMSLPAEAETLKKLDPLLHIDCKRTYPAVLLQHGFNDSRVPVWVSAKLAESLQQCGTTVVMRSSNVLGHGTGSVDEQTVMEAEQLAFVCKVLKCKIGG